MIERLKDVHKDTDYITDEDVLCVKIAALCHVHIYLILTCS